MTDLTTVPSRADVFRTVVNLEQTASSWVGSTTRALVPAGSAHRSAVTAVAADRSFRDEAPDLHPGLVFHPR